MDDVEAGLISRCQAGDKEAFEELVKQYAGRATGIAHALVGNHADALDASQEAFARAWRSIRRFKGNARFFTWYSTILRNTCISLLRRRKRRRMSQLPDEHPEDSPHVDPQALAVRNEQTQRVWAAVLSLPVKHREVIVLNHFQQMSYKQIAQTLAVPIGTVTSRLHKARAALREKLSGDRP